MMMGNNLFVSYFCFFVDQQEDELREEGSEKHAHLSEDLHVLIEVYAPAADAYNRLAYGIAEVRKYLIPVRWCYLYFE